MKHLSTTAFATATACLLGSTAAYAELTAIQIWDNWKTSVAEEGTATLTGTTTVSGATLIISDVVMTSTEEDGGGSARIDSIMMTENDDGSVTITTSPELTLTFEGKEDDGSQIAGTFVMRQNGLSVNAAENDNGVAYALVAAEMTGEMTEFVKDGEAGDLDLEVSTTGISSNIAATASDEGVLAAQGKTDSLALKVRGTDPDSGGTFDISLSMQDIDSVSLTNTVLGFSNPAADFGKLLRDGLTTDNTFSYGPTTFTMNGEQDGERFSIVGSNQGGSYTLKMDATGVAFTESGRELELVLSGDSIPLPQVTAKLAGWSSAFDMPLNKTDEPQPFRLMTSLDGLAIGNEVWSLFDPVGMLPRDPAKLLIDLSGTGKWFVDVTDRKELMTGETPGEVNTLTLNGLELSLAGARLTGNGGVTFDNTDMRSYFGFPKPVGAFDLLLEGGETLLNTLNNMGLVSTEMAMGIRMQAGMVARPGEAPDTLVSKIEMTEGGSLRANGMTLKP